MKNLKSTYCNIHQEFIDKKKLVKQVIDNPLVSEERRAEWLEMILHLTIQQLQAHQDTLNDTICQGRQEAAK